MNTELFYNRALEYQNKRNAAIAEYEGAMKKIERTKGSPAYTDSSRAAKEKRDNALSTLKTEYMNHFHSIFDDMEAANSARGLKAPTDEELRVLQLLKMKEKVSKADLDAAANTLKGNSTCLSILSEIARKNEIFTNYDNYGGNTEMSVQSAENAINALRSSTADFLNFDVPRAARLYQQQRERFYGASEAENPLPKRAVFNDKASCFACVANMSENDLAAFEAAVD